MFIFLYGEDTYRSAEKLTQIKEKFKKEVDPSGINVITFSADDFDLDKFSSAAGQTGFLVAKRMVIVKNLLLNKPAKNIAETLIERLEHLKKSDNVFVFWEGGAPDKRTSLFKLLAADKKLSQDFAALDNAGLNDWVKEYVKKNNGRINGRAIMLLTAFVGNSLWQLKNELDKLIAFKNGEEINEADVKTFVIAKVSENIFNLTDAVAGGNPARGLKLMEEQLSAGLNEIYILTMLARQFRILTQLSSLAAKKYSEAEIVKETKLHPFVVKKTLPLSKKFSLEKIKGIYQKLVEMDKKFKSTSLPPKALLDLFIMNI
ncbi:MAG: DNA polymerase III subunit delta [Candidatus Komeilibacteria bacterium]|nr:DNA polymerase III subunit delta [Candidatus Komeilibacteria bacterium]